MNGHEPKELGFPELRPWGWDEAWESTLEESLGHKGGLPGRVVRQVHHHYDVVAAPSGKHISTTVSGAFSFRALGPADYPTAGDWVLLDEDTERVQTLLPRRTAIRRSAAGDETLEQVIAANIDVLFLVFGLDGGRNFTTGLLERSLTAAWNSGARPIIVLNKVDQSDRDRMDQVMAEAESSALGVPVHAVSALRGDGIDALVAEARSGETVGMLGKSGVGKSALLNAFARCFGYDVRVREGEQRHADLQGRHTTTHKELVLLPEGPVIADVPGLRELKLWGDSDDLDATFPDIEAFAAECRFRDCSHNGEPGCRVQEALASGELDHERYARYLDLEKELAYLERRKDTRALAEERKKWRQISQSAKNMRKMRGR